MILFPAIDLKDGVCVRLLKGKMDQATVFNIDPAAQARAFADAGCEWLHVVDLNGAFEGRPVNGAAVESIRGAVDMKIQLGGGIRDMATIDRWLEAGVDRVILGTVALRDPDLVRTACRTYPGRIAVGIDARSRGEEAHKRRGAKRPGNLEKEADRDHLEQFVAVEGWAETSEVKVADLALKFEDCGVAAIIYTDIDRDGVLAGPNVKATGELAAAISTPVIASGGVSCLDDLLALREIEKDGVIGAISGRALYDGRIDLAEAIKVFQEARKGEALTGKQPKAVK